MESGRSCSCWPSSLSSCGCSSRSSVGRRHGQRPRPPRGPGPYRPRSRAAGRPRSMIWSSTTSCAAAWKGSAPGQARTIDAVRSGRDLMISAPEGTGKTGAYVIPALERQLHREGLHTLVIAPNIDMVEDIADKAQLLAREADLWVGKI